MYGVRWIRGAAAIIDIPPSREAPASGAPGMAPSGAPPSLLKAIPVQSHQSVVGVGLAAVASVSGNGWVTR